MKILIFSDYGCGCPDAIKQFNAEDYPKNRYGEVISFLENNCESFRTDSFSDLFQVCEANKNKIYRLEGVYNTDEFEAYFGWDSETRCVVCVKVFPLNKNKKYIIEEYDGAEALVELPKYKCIDQTIKLYERK